MTFIQTFKLWMHLTGFSQNARTHVLDFYQSIDQRQTTPQDQVVIEPVFIRI